MQRKKWGELLAVGILLTGFLGGILFILLCGDTYFKGTSLWERESLRLLTEKITDENAYFRYLLWQRGKWYGLLWLMGHTIVGIPALLVLLGWLGFALGVLFTTSVIELRMTGILLSLTMLIPQCVMYVPLTVISAKGILRLGTERFRNRHTLRDSEMEKEYLKLLVCGGCMLLAGVVLESYANPWLVRQAVRYFI
ncbi:MAG: stage II sporulation protein M [Eubacteriales bacterium]|nr:stage II sporulation protein M [Eubacteriales bacterium]